jgi:twinkle protein
MRTIASILTELGIRHRRGLAAWSASCPQCSATRRKKKAECLSVRVDEAHVLWNCHHCGWSGRRHLDGDHRQQAECAKL